MAEDEMLGWHHQLNEHEFEETLGDSERQGSLVCCSPWGHKESDDLVTEQQYHVFFNPFIHQWKLRLFPCLGYCKQYNNHFLFRGIYIFDESKH